MTVGIYAEDFSDEVTKLAHDKVMNIVKEYKQVLQLHGFYLDQEKKILNFDLVISFDDEAPLETIKMIQEQVQSIMAEYQIIINFDQDFSLS